MKKKSIIMCFDGTWNTPGHESSPAEDDSTNVFRFYERISGANDEGQVQLKWYNKGVGTEWMNRVRGGAFGLNLDKHIIDGYRFLIQNFKVNDDLYLIGFSRGAYTARSLAGLIRNSGLLNGEDDDLIDRAYGMYRSREGVDSEHAIAFRKANSREISIKFIGVWDTVGALGIPLKPFAEFNAEQYGFHDTKLSSSIQNAFHAVAVDEHREPYAATLWQQQDQRDRDKGQVLEQVWFSGAHADVGGGYTGNHPISDLTLRWMQKRALGCGLKTEVLPAPQEDNVLNVEIHDSFKEFLGGFFSFFTHRYYRVMGAADRRASGHGYLCTKKDYCKERLSPQEPGAVRYPGDFRCLVVSSAEVIDLMRYLLTIGLLRAIDTANNLSFRKSGLLQKFCILF